MEQEDEFYDPTLHFFNVECMNTALKLVTVLFASVSCWACVIKSASPLVSLYNKTFNDVAYGMVSFCEINIKDYKVLKSNQELSGERV